MDTTRSGPPTHEAIAQLPIPATLSGPQRDGRVCVWGGEALTSETAIDLGSRRIGDRMAFPRGCRDCVSKAALGALFDHTTDCRDCDTDTTCETGRTLNRIIRLGQR